MKLLSANVQSRVRAAQGRQLDAVLARNPDAVALQEVTLGNLDAWLSGLGESGYQAVTSKEFIDAPYPPPPYNSPPFPRQPPKRQIVRTCFNLIAARGEVEALSGLTWSDPEEARFAFPEKYLAARVNVGGLGFEIHNAHLPHGSGRGEIKVHAYEAIRRRVDEAGEVALVLCGDFNAPIAENEDGPLPDSDDSNRRWTRSETELLTNPRLRDVYRDVHTRGEPLPVSYFTRARTPGPRRYDFIFASPQVKTVQCRYLTDWLEATEERKALSDHAPVEAVLSANT